MVVCRQTRREEEKEEGTAKGDAQAAEIPSEKKEQKQMKNIYLAALLL